LRGLPLPSVSVSLLQAPHVTSFALTPCLPPRFSTNSGSDMANRAGYAEAYKDVVLENKFCGVNSTAPDYTFRNGGKEVHPEAQGMFIYVRRGPLNLGRGE